MRYLDFNLPDACADQKFLITHVLNVDSRPWLVGVPTPDAREMLLDQASRFFADVVAPLRLKGDIQGVRLDNGRVKTPDGFPEIYRQIRENGFHAATIPEELGGAGLSPVLAQSIEELSAGANLALHMYFGFAASSADAIHKFGDPALAQQVVPKLVSGEWLATMCLTESQAGTDLAQVRTRARPLSDGRYAITGDKIFITGGDSDLSDNVIHVLLARVEDTGGGVTPGLAGLAAFVVARNDLKTGAFNSIEVVGLEHKMGLHAGSTCTLHFEGAIGHRLAPGEGGSAAGMAAIFDMMNHARLSTGVTAIGVAAAAVRMTTAYALERRSGRAVGMPRDGASIADPIIAHPDIYRTIVSAWAFVEGARAVVTWGASLYADAADHPDEAMRREAAAIAHLLTPVLKAYLTDAAFQVCDDCIQVHGGYGFVRETGIEQLARDVRASRIYEGANGIQAQDFVMRRMSGKGGSAVQSLIASIDQFLAEHARLAELAGIMQPLADALTALQVTVTYAEIMRTEDVEGLLESSADLVRLFGIVLIGWRSAVSVVAATHGAPELLERKRLLARQWAVRHLPLTAGLASVIDWASQAHRLAEKERIHA